MNEYLQTPIITKETSAGYMQYDIQDEMLEQRKIYCVGEINNRLVMSLILQFQYLQALDGQKEITMYINSQGGDVASGLALYDVMQAVSCPIRTVCVGTSASMGAILFMSGDSRDILPHSKVMIHDPLIAGSLTGNALHIESVSKDLMHTREITGRLIAKHTGKTLEEVYAKTDKDTYFDAEESVRFGFAERIIYEI